MPGVQPPGFDQSVLRHGLLALAALLLATGSGLAVAQDADAARLRTQYEITAERLRDSALGQPLVLESSEDGDLLSGEIYARIYHGLGDLANALNEPRQWCEFLLLHPNTARCEARGGADAPTLELDVTRRIDATDTHHLAFKLQSAASTPDYFGADLTAQSGPMATSDYRIRLEAIPVDAGAMFLHLRYSYRVAWTTRLALKAWLATLAGDCVGFTVTGSTRHGEPEYIRGMRGSAERNVMRYFLAIDAFLRARSAPADERFERSLALWLEDAARYPRQLQDEEIPPYLAVKRRQHPVQPTPAVATR